MYLNGFLRERFNFSGFVVTDGNSCGNVNCQATVKLLKNATAAAEWTEEGHELAAELCLSGGTDIELGSTLTGYTTAAIAHGLVPEAEVSRSNTRLYEQMIAQGHLEAVPFDNLGSSDVDTYHSRQVAFEAAVQAMVAAPYSVYGFFWSLHQSVMVRFMARSRCCSRTRTTRSRLRRRAI